MGLIYADIRLENPLDKGLEPIESKALVDTGAIHLCIPPHMAIQLQLQELEKREVVIADGTRRLCPYVGPVKLSFQKRNCYTGALVKGDTVLLGAIPLEDMDLVVHPSRRSLTVNPDSPNVPTSVAKGVGE